jgi:predicted phage replisome organizer
MSNIDIKWIKLSVAMFDDEKIKLLEDMPDYRALQLIWIKLICLAGKINSHGYIFLAENIPYNNEQLATLFREPVNTIELALTLFTRMKMIEIDNNGVLINNFEKHQSLDKLAKIKDDTKKRVERFRAKSKELNQACNVTETLLLTQCNATDKIRLDKITLDKKGVRGAGDSSKLKLFTELYTSSICTDIPPLLMIELEKLADKYEYSWFEYAISESVKNNARNFKYVQAILENCSVKGFIPSSQVKEQPRKVIYKELK